MKHLYKYPQAEFPYGTLIEKNKRSKEEPEYELMDTGIFGVDASQYHDCQGTAESLQFLWQ